MKKKIIILIIVLILISLTLLVSARDFTPSGNIDMKQTLGIYNSIQINNALYTIAGSWESINSTILLLNSSHNVMIIPKSKKGVAFNQTIQLRDNITIINYDTMYWANNSHPWYHTDYQGSNYSSLFRGNDTQHFKFINKGVFAPRKIYNPATFIKPLSTGAFMFFGFNDIEMIGGEVSDASYHTGFFNGNNIQIHDTYAHNISLGPFWSECANNVILDNIIGLDITGEAYDANAYDRNLFVSNVYQECASSLRDEVLDFDASYNAVFTNIIGKNCYRLTTVQPNQLGTRIGTCTPFIGEKVIGSNLICDNCTNEAGISLLTNSTALWQIFGNHMTLYNAPLEVKGLENIIPYHTPLSAEDLVLYFPFFKGELTDYSESGNTANIIGTSYNISTSKIGKGYQFYGINGTAINHTTDGISMKQGTVCLWFNPTSITNYDTIISNYPADTGYRFYVRLYNQGGHRIRFNVGDSQGQSDIQIEKDYWWHFCGTWDNQTQERKMYLQAKLTNTSYGTYYGPSFDNFQLGSLSSNNTFNGTIDQIMYFNRTLSEQEIQALYSMPQEWYGNTPPVKSKRITDTPTECPIENTFMTAFNGATSTCVAINQSIINISWSNLQDYPVACPVGSYLTQLGDTIVCTSQIPETDPIWTAEKGYYYNKSEVYNKSETYNKSEVYNQTEVYNKTEIESNYVPYTGANANVDIGTNTFDADDITCTNGYLKSISTSAGINPWLESVNDLGVSTKFFTVRSGSAQSGNTWLQNTGNNDFIFKTNGNVGFGTENPTSKFDIYTSTALSGLAITGTTPTIKLNDNFGGAAADFIVWNNGQGVVFEDVTATTPVHPNQFVMRLDNGHVGINNYAPLKALDSLDASDSQLRLTQSANVDYADFTVDSAGDLTIDPSGGDTDITGSLDTTENITSLEHICDSVGCIGDVGLSHMFGLATEIQTVAVIDTWYNVTFNDTLGDIEGLTFSDNTTVTIINDGHYTIHFGMGFEDSSVAPNSDVGMRITLNGVEMVGSYIEYDILNKKDADTWMAHTTHAELSTGDILTMQYIASDTDVTIAQDDTYATQGFVASVYIQEMAE